MTTSVSTSRHNVQVGTFLSTVKPVLTFDRNLSLPNPPGYAPLTTQPITAKVRVSPLLATPLADVLLFSTLQGKGKKAVATGDAAEGQQAMVRASVNRSNELKMKKAWEVALSYVSPVSSRYDTLIPFWYDAYDRPAKSLPMQAFMLYMSGSGIQLFSMGIVWALLTSPWQAVWNVLTSELLLGALRLCACVLIH